MVLRAGRAVVLRAAPRGTSLDGHEALVVTDLGDLEHRVGKRKRHLVAATDVVSLGWVKPVLGGARDALDGGPLGAAYIDTRAQRHLFPLSTWRREARVESPAAMMRDSGFTTLLEALERFGAPTVTPPPEVHATLVPRAQGIEKRSVVVSSASSRALALRRVTNTATALSTTLWVFTTVGLAPVTNAAGLSPSLPGFTAAAVTIALSTNCCLLGAWLALSLPRWFLLRRHAPQSPWHARLRGRLVRTARRAVRGAFRTAVADMAFVLSLRLGMLTALASTTLHTRLASHVPSALSWTITTVALAAVSAVVLIRGVESSRLTGPVRDRQDRSTSTSTSTSTSA